MLLSNVNFKTRTAKFALSSGSLGQEEKDLIEESIDMWTQKVDVALEIDPDDEELRKQYERFEDTKTHVTMLAILDSDDDFLLLDEEANLITYNDLADIMTSLNEHISIIETDGSYLTENMSKYETLNRLLSELNEQRTKFVRVPTRPFGLHGRKK
jgi:hypothetical protein